jgi:multidrug efflux pump subunit AcrA (membrane-fusion protein)
MSIRKKPLVITLVVAAIVASLVGWRATQAKPEQKKDGPVTLEFTPADVAVVEMRSLVRSIPFSGSLAPVVQTAVKSKVPGEVTRVLVREGETVKEGQLLAQIDVTDLQSRVDAQVAALEEAQRAAQHRRKEPREQPAAAAPEVHLAERVRHHREHVRRERSRRCAPRRRSCASRARPSTTPRCARRSRGSSPRRP